MPVDRRVRLDFDVTFDSCLAGQSDFFRGITEDLQKQQRIEPFPEAFPHPLFCDVLFAGRDHHVAAAALTETHAIENLVRAEVNLYSVPAGDGPQVFTFAGLDSDLFIDKPDLGHGSGALVIRWRKTVRKRLPDDNFAFCVFPEARSTSRH